VTAAQVSDIHLGEISRVQRRMLDELVALHPDLVLVTGDLVDDDVAVGELADLLGGYQPRLGTWAVPGNRDHKAEAVDPLRQALAARNAHMLVNQSAQVEDGLWIVGVDDPSDRRDDLRAALRDVPAEAMRILLAHAPNIVERLGGTAFDLILAGHTHGGQVNLPLLQDQWLQDDSARRYPAGLYKVGDSKLYVNRGIGTYYLPIRIGARPEITLFTLHGE
jgi:predicted MPP superfamily phosphohydrolase